MAATLVIEDDPVDISLADAPVTLTGAGFPYGLMPVLYTPPSESEEEVIWVMGPDFVITRTVTNGGTGKFRALKIDPATGSMIPSNEISFGVTEE